MYQKFNVQKRLRTIHFQVQKIKIWIEEKKITSIDDVSPKEKTLPDSRTRQHSLRSDILPKCPHIKPEEVEPWVDRLHELVTALNFSTNQFDYTNPTLPLVVKRSKEAFNCPYKLS